MPHSSYKKCFLALPLICALAATARADVVAHWSFDELTGPDHDTYADTGGAATKHNALVADKAQVSINVSSNTPFGKSVTFTGKAGSYLDVPPIPELHDHSFTIAVWVYIESNDHNFVLADWSAPNNLAFAFGLDTGKGGSVSRLTAFMRNDDFKTNKKTKVRANTDIVRFQPSTPVPLSSWHHVAWVWDRTDATAPTLTGYLDAAKVSTSTLAKGVTKIDLLDNRRPIKIGLKQDTENSFHGSMDELWIFSDALTADQITNLMRTNDIGTSAQVAAAAPATPPPTSPAIVAVAPATPATPSTPSAPPANPTTPAAAAPGTAAPAVITPAPTTPDSIAAAPPATPASPTTPAAPNTVYVPTAPPTPAPATIKPFVPLAPPTVAVASSHYTPERMLAIAGSGTLALTLSGFLIWATKERSRMRHPHR